MKTNPTLSRRKFLQLTSVTGTYLVVGCVPGPNGKEKIANITEEGTPLNQFIQITSSDKVILFNHRPEMGQGTFQSIPMILAEELEVDINSVEIRQSEANKELYGRQMVVGSHSIQNEYDKLRKMGAAAKEMLIKAAADQWQIDVTECYAEDGMVKSKASQKELRYGDLVEKAGSLPAPENPVLKSPENFKIIGQPLARRDIPMKTNGEVKFGIDAKVKGMLYASIERSPVFQGTVKDYDKESALKVPGVKHVLETKRMFLGKPRVGIAVLADSYWAAIQGRKALKVQWDSKGFDNHSTESIEKEFMRASSQEGEILIEKGNKRTKRSGRTLEAVYQLPYQAHVPMEPVNATVCIMNDRAEFWGSTQNPNGIKSMIAKNYDLPEDKVKINYTFMGGGFGRRSMTDFVEEAADLSYQINAPVKVIWTREDDLTQGPFRACSLNVCKAEIDDQGAISSLEHKVVSQEIWKQDLTKTDEKAGKQIIDGINTDYEIPHIQVKGVLKKVHIPIWYWRAVYHSTNPFAHESFIDELAFAVGKDPLHFRQALLTKHERFTRVLEETKKITSWNSSKREGVGRGLAIAERSGAHFAMVTEVSRQNNKIKIDKVTTIIDLGICINPDTVKAQTEGSIVMGLGAALSGLEVQNGKIVQQNFDTYSPLRIKECPVIETHIIESDANPDGAGESGLPTVAPSLANAIFDLTGKRIRKLPVDLAAIS